jgi:hypothetical protein
MRNLHWLIPPLLGVAAFYWARATPAPDPLENATLSAKQLRQASGITDLKAAMDSFHAEDAKMESKRGDEVKSMNLAGLQERVLELRKKAADFNPDTDWDEVERTDIDLRQVAEQLGKVAKRDGLEWIAREAPELYASVMAGVAEVDPDLAMSEIVASKRQNPCFSGTLMSLLEREGEKGTVALAAACRAVPWELSFGGSDDPFGEGFELSSDVDLAPWIESGAALALANDGVQIDNLFSIWARSDPRQALEHWERWPGAGPDDESLRLVRIFMAGMDRDQDRDRISVAFGQLPEEQQRKITGALAASRWAKPLADRYPGLVPPNEEGTR